MAKTWWRASVGLAGATVAVALVGAGALPAGAAPGSGLSTRIDQVVTAAALGRDVTVAVSVGGQLLYEYDVQEEGDVYVTSAVVDGHTVLRPCITNFRTTQADVAALIETILRTGRALESDAEQG